MKNNKMFVLFALAVVIGQGCKKLEKLTQFEMKFSEEFVVKSTAGTNLPFNIFSPDIETNSESKFEVNDTRKDLVEEIKLTELKILLKGPSNSDFSFLKSVEMFLSAEGLDEVLIASRYDIPDNIGKELLINPSGADFQEYIKKDKFKFRMKTVTDKVITSDHTMQSFCTFFVDAKVLGN